MNIQVSSPAHNQIRQPSRPRLKAWYISTQGIALGSNATTSAGTSPQGTTPGSNATTSAGTSPQGIAPGSNATTSAGTSPQGTTPGSHATTSAGTSPQGIALGSHATTSAGTSPQGIALGSNATTSAGTSPQGTTPGSHDPTLVLSRQTARIIISYAIAPCSGYPVQVPSPFAVQPTQPLRPRLKAWNNSTQGIALVITNI